MEPFGLAPPRDRAVYRRSGGRSQREASDAARLYMKDGWRTRTGRLAGAGRASGGEPRYRHLYRTLRERIASGEIPAGTRLPSTRATAVELGISRNTVLLAYEQLTAEGYVRGRAGGGTVVQHVEREAAPAGTHASVQLHTSTPRRLRMARFGRAVTARRSLPLLSGYVSERPRLAFDFRYGLPAIADFPVASWQRHLSRCARKASVRAHDYGHPQGSPALREALARYLLRARGVRCRPSHIVVTTGSQQGLDLGARLLLDVGERAIVEEPGYEGARRTFAAAGAELEFVPTDQAGLDVDALGGRSARVVHVTPSHQYPLGGILPYPRRVALLAWAASSDAYVFEDDYDSEYRYEGRPVEALKSLDTDDRVLYLGTFSKVMFPALRLGYAVLPEALVEPFTRAKLIADGGTSVLEQDALADFLSSGEFERHIRRSRMRYGERRSTLLSALDEQLGERVEVVGASAGMHVVAWLRDVPAGATRDLVARAATAGVGIYSIAPHYHTQPRRAGLVLGYTGLPAGDIHAGIARLTRVLDR